MKLKLSQFDFKLPPELLAKKPLLNRDDSRMMVVHKDTGVIEHKKFTDLLDYFEEDDVLILNNTKVIPARLYGNKEKTGAKIEVFLMRELNKESRLWDVLVDPARKIRIGNKLYFGDNEEFVAEVIDNTTSRGRTLRFLYDGPYDEFRKKLYDLGETPLPKYLDREPEPEDVEVNIKPDDYRKDIFHASGPGGQHVNKTASAVRLTHHETGIVVSMQDEKSQHKNLAKALRILKSRLYEKMQQEEHDKRAEERKTLVGSGDRSQRIRTYNFPENRLTDHRINATIYKLDQIVAGSVQLITDQLIDHDRQQLRSSMGALDE